MYDYSLDIWNVGVLFAEMIFQKMPFFHGRDNHDQLVKIAKVLGTQGLYDYIKKYDLRLDSSIENMLSRYKKKPWTKFVNNCNNKYICNEALDFIDKLIKYDHNERLTASEAMEHSYFEPICKYSRVKLESITYGYIKAMMDIRMESIPSDVIGLLMEFIGQNMTKIRFGMSE